MKLIAKPKFSLLIRNAALLTAALALALGVSACGGDDDEGTTTEGGTTAAEAGVTGAAGEIEPCTLLTPAEVEAAGVKTTKPQSVESPIGGQACNYGDDPLEGVQVIVQPGGGQTYYDQAVDLLSETEPISGLGDEAVLDASNPQQVTVVTMQDDTVLQVGGSISAEDAESLAEKALGRLGD